MMSFLRNSALAVSLCLAPGVASAQTSQDSGEIIVVPQGGFSHFAAPDNPQRILGVRIRTIRNQAGNNFLDATDPLDPGGATGGSTSGASLDLCVGSLTMRESAPDFFEASLEITQDGTSCIPRASGTGTALIINVDGTALPGPRLDAGPDVLANDFTGPLISGQLIGQTQQITVTSNANVSVTIRFRVFQVLPSYRLEVLSVE